MARIIGLYHYPCPDGIAAALACHIFHQQQCLPLTLIPHSTYVSLPVEDLNLRVSPSIPLQFAACSNLLPTAALPRNSPSPMTPSTCWTTAGPQDLRPLWPSGWPAA